MNAELKAKWMEALRSGKYVQGHGGLRSDADEFCCLGVLHDIAGGTWELEHGRYYGDGASGFSLTDARRKECDLSKDEVSEAIKRNDGMCEFATSPQSFAQIADWIEANL